MSNKRFRAKLTSHYGLMMSVCHEGRCVGLIFLSHGEFEGEIGNNPLKGPEFEPDMRWFIISEDSSSFGLLEKELETALTKDGVKITGLRGLKIGLPKHHIDKLMTLEEFEEIE